MSGLIRIKFIALNCLFILISCNNNSTISPAKPVINSISPIHYYAGSTLTIYGTGFGLPSDSSKICIDSSTLITSKNCFIWNDVLIKFTVPKISKSGNIYILIGKDTSNKTAVSIDRLPIIDMVDLNPGSFTMGSLNGFINEQPLHQVTISYSYSISKYEVTQDLYQNVTDTNPSPTIGMNYPVSNISWLNAILFCNTLSKLAGYDTCYKFNGNVVKMDTSSKGYRLPTEAEWEYACRAGTTSDYYGSNDPSSIGWYNENSGYIVHPVGEKLPNSLGIYDMLGNVNEWCWDYFDPKYYAVSAKTNPIGPVSGTSRVRRGGSWSDSKVFVRSSNRTFQDNSIVSTGIRLVRKK